MIYMSSRDKTFEVTRQKVEIERISVSGRIVRHESWIDGGSLSAATEVYSVGSIYGNSEEWSRANFQLDYKVADNKMVLTELQCRSIEDNLRVNFDNKGLNESGLLKAAEFVAKRKRLTLRSDTQMIKSTLNLIVRLDSPAGNTNK